MATKQETISDFDEFLSCLIFRNVSKKERHTLKNDFLKKIEGEGDNESEMIMAMAIREIKDSLGKKPISSNEDRSRFWNFLHGVLATNTPLKIENILESNITPILLNHKGWLHLNIKGETEKFGKLPPTRISENKFIFYLNNTFGIATEDTLTETLEKIGYYKSIYKRFAEKLI
jgi:hypothetical protein